MCTNMQWHYVVCSAINTWERVSGILVHLGELFGESIFWDKGMWAITWDITVVVLSSKQIASHVPSFLSMCLSVLYMVRTRCTKMQPVQFQQCASTHCTTWGNLLCVCVSCTILFDIKCTRFRTKSSSLLKLLYSSCILWMSWLMMWSGNGMTCCSGTRASLYTVGAERLVHIANDESGES